jgi:NhaA family Na+:H+ antiporter
LTDLPEGVNWRQIVGVSFLGGIGFTMSLFIAGLAFDDQMLLDRSKIGILLASIIAGGVGYLLLRVLSSPAAASEENVAAGAGSS